MYLSLILLALLSAFSFNNVWAAGVDYSHCVNHVGEYKEDSPFPVSKGYSMTRSGEIIVAKNLQNSPQLEVVREKDRMFVRVKEGGSIYLDFKRKNDVISEIKEAQNGTVTKFDVRGGKCLVTEISKPKNPDEPFIINTDLCHEIESYIAKNPEAAECRCGNEQTDKALSVILRKYIPTYNGAANPKKITRSDWEDLASPSTMAYEKMARCYSQSDFKAMLKDPALWQNYGKGAPADEKATR